MKPTGVYCPIYGFDPPCNVCMWSLTKRGRIFCAVAWDARKQTCGGRGKEGEIDGHDYAPWITNSVEVER